MSIIGLIKGDTENVDNGSYPKLRDLVLTGKLFQAFWCDDAVKDSQI